ncbi:MAG TPA: hypothetical protein VF457_10905 [Burkholderiaceae bacterium]
MPSSTDTPNNEHLRDLLRRAGLKPAAAITLFNRGRAQPVAASTWNAWMAAPGSSHLKPLPDDELAHAQRAFVKLLMPC